MTSHEHLTRFDSLRDQIAFQDRIYRMYRSEALGRTRVELYYDCVDREESRDLWAMARWAYRRVHKLKRELAELNARVTP